MTKNIKIHGVFPTPVFETNLNRKVTDKEFNFILNNRNKTYEAIGTNLTNDKYILDNKDLLNIKMYLESCLEDYKNLILNSKNNFKIYITQSWVSYINNGNYHEVHRHPNSFISGVFYVKANPEFDSIRFWKDNYEPISFEINEYNMFNGLAHTFSVEDGRIILFPSNLRHEVLCKNNNETRISLAFNTFIKGEIGIKDHLTGLKI